MAQAGGPQPKPQEQGAANAHDQHAAAHLLAEHPDQRQGSEEHGHGEDMAQGFHPAAWLGQAPAQRRHETQQQKRQGNAQAQPGEYQHGRSGRKYQRRPQCRRHERPGTGRGHECSQRPGPEGAAAALAGGQALAGIDRRELEQARQVECDGSGQQQQDQDHAWVLELEGPAELRTTRPQGKQQCPQQDTNDHHAAGIGQCFTSGRCGAAVGPGNAQGLEAEDREYARHQVEQQPTKHGACQGHEGRHQGTGGLGRVAGGVYLQPQAVTQGQHRVERGRHLLAHFGFDEQKIVGAFHVLRGRVVDHARSGDEQVRVLDFQGGREGDADPDNLVFDLEARRRAERPGQGLPPGGEGVAHGRVVAPVSDGQLHVEGGLFRNTGIVAAGQVFHAQANRQLLPGRQVGRHLQRYQQGIGVFVDMVHQAVDQQCLRHRVGRFTDADPLGQLPGQLWRQAHVPRLLPVTVPVALWLHDDGEGGALPRGGGLALCRQRRGNEDLVIAGHGLRPGSRADEGTEQQCCDQAN
uniref:Uncharacterized protein n=1 Tax=biofilter metagenome TaxID=1070537 RepID=A0A193SBV6_9ZZZZ